MRGLPVQDVQTSLAVPQLGRSVQSVMEAAWSGLPSHLEPPPQIDEKMHIYIYMCVNTNIRIYIYVYLLLGALQKNGPRLR